jgi:hypothetical protein
VQRTVSATLEQVHVSRTGANFDFLKMSVKSRASEFEGYRGQIFFKQTTLCGELRFNSYHTYENDIPGSHALGQAVAALLTVHYSLYKPLNCNRVRQSRVAWFISSQTIRTRLPANLVHAERGNYSGSSHSGRVEHFMAKGRTRAGGCGNTYKHGSFVKADKLLHYPGSHTLDWISRLIIDRNLKCVET